MATFRGTDGPDQRDAYRTGERNESNSYDGLFGNDSLYSGDLADTLDGDGGDDRLLGRAGDDFFQGGAGNDSMDGGTGDDVFTDFGGRSTVVGGAGNDTANVFTWNGAYDLGSGNDTIFGLGDNDSFQGGDSDGRLTLDGGSGVDTIVLYTEDLLGVTVNLSTGRVRNGEGLSAMVRNVENVEGAEGDDRLTGSSGANLLIGDTGDDVLDGGAGADRLFGDYDGLDSGGGADRLVGGAGNDQLFGGFGADSLIGGLGSDQIDGGFSADRFVYTSTTDSDDRNGRDVVAAFLRSEGDRFDLRSIDADVSASGNQAFSFIGTAGFSGDAGELRYSVRGGDAYIQADVDGDRAADMMIRVNEFEAAFVAGDFVL